MKDIFEIKKGEPFEDYDEFMQYLLHIVNIKLTEYIEGMKVLFSNGQGNFKNVIYPDIEVASDVCSMQINNFEKKMSGEDEQSQADQGEENVAENNEELLALLGGFFQNDQKEEENDEGETESASQEEASETEFSTEDMIRYVMERADATEKGMLPVYDICSKLEFEPFTVFALACGIIASTQTSYASVFQVVNQNGSYSAPTVESAGRLYYGDRFSITDAFKDMSKGLEQLIPILDIHVNPNMPFTTVITLDKRVIDFFFSPNKMRLDENYIRFFQMLTDDEELDPILANKGQLEAMEIAYEDGNRIFGIFGDEGSGRRFFIKHFCRDKNKNAVIINCKKLFVYDFSFVEKALWAVCRECILTDSFCCLNDLTYREEEKEKFFGYMDLAFSKLLEHDIIVYAVSKEKIPLKQITDHDFVEIELPTPTNTERENCWHHYSVGYDLADDVDPLEMSAKFLFTPGKVKSAIRYAKSLSVMAREEKISRTSIFKGCNAQMSSELSQKATRVEAKFGFEDIVMNEDQREAITHAIQQMVNKKQVYENWDYMKKYPYGRGLTVLLFGAPGTGKSMMAQVIAHELNLELYRVDVSKVVDKYVGETEKSLSMIFREAKKCNVVLFFDECDTIFAKRSDDGGSNQASANNKTALLLQEMEAYDGVCVLATNYKHNIDPAFFRRMKYIVEFQFPNPDTREMLWRTTVPKTTPLAEDVDFRFIAERFEFAGGNIKNCILNAAFLAAEDPEAEGEVHMKHYLQAIKYEFVKTGKVFTKADFEPYAHLIGL